MTKKEIEKILNQVPAGYYQKLNFFQKLWHEGKFKVIKELLIFENPKRILDLGCNDGTMTSRIASLFPEAKVAGIDLFEKGIIFARRKNPKINFLVGDILKLTFKEKFDLITCLETIEHVQDPEQLVKEIKNNLASGGVAIIEMDSGNWLFKLAWITWTKMGGRVWDGSHLWKTHKNKLWQLLKKTGLKIEKAVSFNLGMGVTFKLRKE